MDDAVAKFKNAVEAALDKAKSDCDSGANPETVRTNFKNSLATARKALVADRQSADKVGEQVKKLAETRRATVKKALDDFKATVEAARAELKKAFGEN